MRTITTYFIVFFIGAFTFSACEKDENAEEKTVSFPLEQLPTPTRNFIQSYFREFDYGEILINKNDYNKYYQITLVAGINTVIYFNRNGDWYDIISEEGITNLAIYMLLPVEIKEYMYKTYNYENIIHIGKRPYGFIVATPSSGSLAFDPTGELLK